MRMRVRACVCACVRAFMNVCARVHSSIERAFVCSGERACLGA